MAISKKDFGEVLEETEIKTTSAVSPTWVYAAEVTAPGAGDTLVSKTVSAGKSGYIYGFFLTAGEANDFRINWTSGGSSYSKRITFGSAGTIESIASIPMNEGLPADEETSITITVVNAAGAGVAYQANLLYYEE